MRKLVIGALVSALALAIAAIALADTTQTYTQKFSSNRTNKSAGISFSTSSNDPSNPKNQQPKSVRTFNIKFPAGTKVNSNGAPICKATDDQMTQAGGNLCKKAVIGAGQARVKLPFPGFADINATVKAFNAKKSLLLYVNPQGAQPIILRPKFKGNLNNGPTLSTVVPPNCLPPATNQGGQCKKQDGSAGDEAILDFFSLKTVAKKQGKAVLIRTPKSCKGKWNAVATLKYADGTSKSITSPQPCKK